VCYEPYNPWQIVTGFFMPQIPKTNIFHFVCSLQNIVGHLSDKTNENERGTSKENQRTFHRLATLRTVRLRVQAKQIPPYHRPLLQRRSVKHHPSNGNAGCNPKIPRQGAKGNTMSKEIHPLIKPLILTDKHYVIFTTCNWCEHMSITDVCRIQAYLFYMFYNMTYGEIAMYIGLSYVLPSRYVAHVINRCATDTEYRNLIIKLEKLVTNEE
jgi:hypothetical protein